jgi:hypothetical protein
MVTEILRAAAQNGSLIELDAGSAQVVAGVNRVVVPADGDSLAWGVIKITDSESSPMVNEFRNCDKRREFIFYRKHASNRQLRKSHLCSSCNTI